MHSRGKAMLSCLSVCVCQQELFRVPSFFHKVIFSLYNSQTYPSLVPRLFGEGEKRAWYLLFALSIQIHMLFKSYLNNM